MNTSIQDWTNFDVSCPLILEVSNKGYWQLRNSFRIITFQRKKDFFSQNHFLFLITLSCVMKAHLSTNMSDIVFNLYKEFSLSLFWCPNWV